jgi:hypothetical protein
MAIKVILLIGLVFGAIKVPLNFDNTHQNNLRNYLRSYNKPGLKSLPSLDLMNNKNVRYI